MDHHLQHVNRITSEVSGPLKRIRTLQ
jgi:hypothetical protein